MNLYRSLKWCLGVLSFLWMAMPLGASDFSDRMDNYALRYSRTKQPEVRLARANDFFEYLYAQRYIDSQVRFPADAHMDSVDVNVWYYLAEYYYGEGDYRRAVQYCENATASCTEHVDPDSRGDVYSLLGAAYFRLSEFDKAAEALNECYLIDSKSGNYDHLSSTLNNIAGVYIAAGKPAEAEKYVREAVAANSLTSNLARRAVIFGTASEMYKAMGDPKQSLSYARKALAIERQRKDSARMGVRLSQVANAELAMGKVDEAKRSLTEAMPLLEKAGNTHSLGICQNQMGDILLAQGDDKEAAEYYREAAALFFIQGDLYNESHAREGLGKALKTSAPDEAVLHLERVKQLQDSIHSRETDEAISRYNAIYHNDILQQEAQRAKAEKRRVLWIAVAAVLALVLIMAAAACYTYRRHKRNEQEYNRNMSSMEDKYSEADRRYRNIMSDQVFAKTEMTEDDRLFLSNLAEAISVLSEQGELDLKTLAKTMHVSVSGMRTRLDKLVSETPQSYILKVRMSKAKYLLHNFRDMPISVVAEKCGYMQLPNFTRAVTKYYGVTPTQMRNTAPIDKPKLKE